MTSIVIYKVTSALREGGGKAKCTLRSLVKSVKLKLDHLAYLAESQDLEGPSWQICFQMCGIWPLCVGYDLGWDWCFLQNSPVRERLFAGMCGWLFHPQDVQFKLDNEKKPQCIKSRTMEGENGCLPLVGLFGIVFWRFSVDTQDRPSQHGDISFFFFF